MLKLLFLILDIYDSVIVGNGYGIPISTIGQFKIYQTSPILQRTLLVPSHKKKLLSISQVAANQCGLLLRQMTLPLMCTMTQQHMDSICLLL